MFTQIMIQKVKLNHNSEINVIIVTNRTFIFQTVLANNAKVKKEKETHFQNRNPLQNQLINILWRIKTKFIRVNNLHHIPIQHAIFIESELTLELYINRLVLDQILQIDHETILVQEETIVFEIIHRIELFQDLDMNPFIEIEILDHHIEISYRNRSQSYSASRSNSRNRRNFRKYNSFYRPPSRPRMNRSDLHLYLEITVLSIQLNKILLIIQKIPLIHLKNHIINLKLICIQQ